MQKKKVFKIADSNVEGIGTDADKKCRATAAATEKAWKKIKVKEGMWTWRIEKFKVKSNLDAKGGVFYDDDSYILLNCYKDKTTDKFKWDVHFWLGETTSQDEAGTAAYKTVELDDFVNANHGGDPVQHREVSKHESRMFLSYFPDGIRLLQGGVESGFNHVKPEEMPTRLMWLKGKKNIRCVQVPIEIASLNSGDVFILDAGLMLYQYQGTKCGKNEKLRAGKMQRLIDDERKGKPEVFVFSQCDKPDSTMGEFFSYFQEDLKGEDIKEGTEVPPERCAELIASIDSGIGGSDESWEKDTNKALYQLSDESGSLVMTKVEPIEKSALSTTDVFIFDIGLEIFVWIGKGASKAERAQGMNYATKYMKEHDRPDFLPVTQIFEGGENELFDGSF